MSTAPSITSAWQYYTDFYRRLSETPGWSNQAAMLEFVERIAPVAITEKIYPSSSHHILYLSYEYRGHAPTVRIWCGGADSRFAVSWSGKWNNAEIVERIDDALLQRIVAWLKGDGQTA
jgi:hypothetical protein